MNFGKRLFDVMPTAGVALLLGAGIAVVAPRIALAAQASNDAMLCESLRYLRAEIQVYAEEHSDVAPGYAASDEQSDPDAESLASISDDIPINPAAADAERFVRQLTLFTDTEGHIRPERTDRCDRGPYMVAIPPNPITLKWAVQVVDQAEMPKVDESRPYGWIYNAHTKRIIANVAGVDSSGVRYADY